MLEHLKGLPKLKSVLLNKTAVTEKGLATLGEINTIENLDLRGCGTNNEGIAHLAGLTKLRGLRLSTRQAEDTSDLSSPTSTVNDDGLDVLGQLTNLQVLALDNLIVSEAGLAKLKNLRQLKELYLAGTPITDSALPIIAEFPELRTLRIAETRIGDAGLAHLEKLPQLEDLDISRCQFITDAGLAHVGKLTPLKKLNLWRVSGVTDDGVAKLAGLANLEWLNLDNILFTDAGVKHLQPLSNVTFCIWVPRKSPTRACPIWNR